MSRPLATPFSGRHCIGAVSVPDELRHGDLVVFERSTVPSNSKR